MEHFENRIRRFNEKWIGFVMDYIPVSADFLSIMTLLFTFIVFWQIIESNLLSAGILFLIASSFDMLDGALARARGTARPFGAFLDSVIDRYSEMLVFLGLLINMLLHRPSIDPIIVIAVFLSLHGSLITSYIRARAESLGFKGSGGIVDRPVRVVLMSIGLILNLIDYFLLLMAVLTNISAIQRFFLVWKQSRIRN